MSGEMTIGQYRLVGPQVASIFVPRRLLLDTNVVIEVEHVYFGAKRNQRNRDVLDGVGVLLSEYHRLSRQRQGGVEVLYGHALAEAAWRRGQGVDRVRWRRMKHAADTAFGWSGDELAGHLANRRAPVMRDKAWRSLAVPLGATPDTDGPVTFLMATYAALLHLWWLDSQRRYWKQKGALYALGLYADWICNTLGAFRAYEIQLAVDVLLGRDRRRKKARPFLSVGGSERADTIADRRWKAAWDVFFLRATESATFRVSVFQDVEPRSTVLVTRDRDPGFVRKRAQVLGADMWRDHGSLIGFTWTEHTAAHCEIHAALGPYQSDSNEREGRPHDEAVGMVLAATRAAEAKLGVEISLSGGRVGKRYEPSPHWRHLRRATAHDAGGSHIDARRSIARLGLPVAGTTGGTESRKPVRESSAAPPRSPRICGCARVDRQPSVVPRQEVVSRRWRLTRA